MPITFNDVINRTEQLLLGFTRDQVSITYLAAPMTDTDLTFQVDPETVQNLSRGLVEIEDELILVKKFDRATGTVTVFGNGRGMAGTTPAAHASGTFVLDDPRYPKVRVKEAINDTILGTYPDLFVFGEHEFSWTAARYEYPLPADVEDVYRVTVNTIGPSKVWFPATSWRFNPQATLAGTQALPDATGKSLQVMRDFITPGRNVRVIYTKKPTTLALDADEYETVSGLPERTVDLITYGACWRLVPALEAGRLQQQNVEASERSLVVQPGNALQTAQYFERMYLRRLEEERDRFLTLFNTYQTWNS